MKLEKRILVSTLYDEIVLKQIQNFNNKTKLFIEEVSNITDPKYALINDGLSLSLIQDFNYMRDEYIPIAFELNNPASLETFIKLVKLKNFLELNRDEVMYAIINTINRCNSMDEIFNAFPTFILPIISSDNIEDFSRKSYWYVMPDEEVTMIKKFYFISKLL